MGSPDLQWHTCVNGWHPPLKTNVGVLPWTYQSEGKWLTEQIDWRAKQPSQVAFSVAEPRTLHHRSPGGEMRGKRKRSSLKGWEGHPIRRHWGCFKGNRLGKHLRDRVERIYGLFQAHRYRLELNWTECIEHKSPSSSNTDLLTSKVWVAFVKISLQSFNVSGPGEPNIKEVTFLESDASYARTISAQSIFL